MTNILDKIFADKQKELPGTKRNRPLSQLKQRIGDQAPVRDVIKALNEGKHSKIIAEIKRRTPFKGELRENFNASEIAGDYARYGAATLSILTESNYFGSNIEILQEVRPIAPIPLLRKDFIFDPYQILQSKIYHADAILLIISILSDNQIKEFIEIANNCNLDCLVETHTNKELERAMKIGYPIIGINNRNLNTLDINDYNTINLLSNIPKEFTIVAESGIKTHDQIKQYNDSGIFNFLIGESILKSTNISNKIKKNA